MKKICKLLSLCVAVSATTYGQVGGDQPGIKVGSFTVQPTIDAEAGYDDRVTLVGNDATGDMYSQWGVAAKLSNAAARYGLTAEARYGQRFYADNSEFNDDLYSLRAGLSSGENPLRWGLSSSVTKSLSYNTAADASSGTGPTGILTDQTSRNFTADATASYEQSMTERTAISPFVGASHFFQDFETGNDAEWQTYFAGCEVAFAYSDQTLFTVSGSYSEQVNDDEDGSVSSVTVGTRRQQTDTINWSAEIGIAAADYDVSGSDQGLAGQVRISWQTTTKISTYAFGSQAYQPGYDGSGARDVYRGGYGADWQLSPRWSFSGQGLHNYEKSVGNGSGGLTGGVEHYFTVSTTHSLTDRAAITGGISFANDEFEVDQSIYFLRISASL